MHSPTGLNADPTFRRQRAVKAARTRTTVDYHVRRVIDRAGELTDQHRRDLAAIVSGGGR